MNAGTTRSKDVVTAFLSCSVRKQDRPLVAALERGVLAPMGFRCLTLGRNVSLADQADDAVRQLVAGCECLIGVATERLAAVDREVPDRTLSLATPYLLQETTMAFQSEMPFLVFRVPSIVLQGVTARNVALELRPELKSGRVSFLASKATVYSALRDLKARALKRREALSREELKKKIGWAATLLGGAYAATKGIDLLLRPECFGDFYYADSECSDCSYRTRCKAEKALRQGAA